MTTPIQSLMQTIADCIHDGGAYKGDDVTKWGLSGGPHSIQYAVGPDIHHDSRTYRVITVAEDQALDLAILVQDAYNAGWSEGYETKR